MSVAVLIHYRNCVLFILFFLLLFAPQLSSADSDPGQLQSLPLQRLVGVQNKHIRSWDYEMGRHLCTCKKDLFDNRAG